MSVLRASIDQGFPRGRADYYGGEIPWAKIDDLNGPDGVVYATKESITTAGLSAIRGRLFPAGTLLFAMYGSVGKMAWSGVNLATNQAILGISVRDTDRLDRRYLRRWLEAQRSVFERDANGVTQKNLSAGYVRALEIPLPLLEEQRRIATTLDKADNLRRKRQEAIRLADAFLRASFLEMVADVKERVPVANLLADVPNAARTGPFGSQLLVSEFTDSGVPVLGIDNVVQNEFAWGQRRFISKEKYQELERYTVRPGDVMVTIMGTTGRVAIAPDDLPTCISTKHLCTLTLNQAEMLPAFLWACLRWDPDVKQQTQRQAKGAIMEGWNMGIVKGLLVPTPTIQRQREFASLLRSVDFLRARMVSSLKDGDLLLSSLQAQYFE